VSTDSWRPVFTGAHQQVQAVYRDARGATVEVAGIVYRTQRQGAELVGEGSRLLGDGDFPIQSERVASEAVGEFREVVFTDGAGARFVIWSVYDINGHHFVVPLQSQLWYGARSIFGSPVSSLLAARTPCEPSCDLARARLGSFLNTMGSDLLRALAEPARATGSGARTTGFVP
jgi:EpsI family protein